MHIALINKSTCVSDKDFIKLSNAINAQLTSFCIDWRIEIRQLWYNTYLKIPPGYLPIYLQDNVEDAPNALGYHTEEHGRIYGIVACKRILDAGGGVLNGGSINDSVSAVVHHEVLEAIRNPNVNRWLAGPVTINGLHYAEVSAECCDPVQGNTWTLNNVLLSNYVLPAWEDPQNMSGPWDKLSKLKAPLSVADGGYAVVRDTLDTPRAVFAKQDAMPWRRKGRAERITSPKQV